MANVPLNLFKNLTLSLSAYSSNDEAVLYISPPQRATILLNVQAANISSSFQTVSLALSSKVNSTQAFVVSGFSIPPFDTASLTLGKIVLVEDDRLIGWSSDNKKVDLVISLLETINTAT